MTSHIILRWTVWLDGTFAVQVCQQSRL